MIMASQIGRNLCVVIGISRANSDTSFIYACKVDNDNSIVEENPFYLANKNRLRLWSNSQIRTEQLRLYDVIRYDFSASGTLFFDQKIEERMVSHLLLDFLANFLSQSNWLWETIILLSSFGIRQRLLKPRLDEHVSKWLDKRSNKSFCHPILFWGFSKFTFMS